MANPIAPANPSKNINQGQANGADLGKTLNKPDVI
jgi:hypothetical protein